jgi:soluble lytic murein transglycosylase-like protein
MKTVMIGIPRVTLAVLFAAASLPAQTPRQSTRAAMEASLASQRAAALDTADSLALQRASVEKQTGQPGQKGFFVLARPARLGAAAALVSGACEPLPEPDVDALVERAAKSQDLDETLLRGVMRQESAFRPCAVSQKGAMGLMQLMPVTARQLGVPNPFDPAANTDAGAKFLKELLVRYGGDMSLALGAYNAGPSEVDAAGGLPAIPETQDYVKRILSALSPKQ